jgi:hypothetical protein
LQGAAFRRAAARLLLVFAIGVGLRTPAGGAEVLDDAPAAAEDSHAQRPLSFTRDVVPVFTKLGCNAGSCHGSFQGRGGFRLSLLGFDPQADYAAVVYEGRGRRVFPAAPGMSLLLRKPTLQVPHGGGLRLIPESAAYRILNTWLSQGMPAPEAGKLRVVRLEPNLSALNMQPGDTHDLCAQAVWSDGVVTEASTWAQFDTTDERVAVVDGNGTIRAVGPGRAAITMRFMGQVAVATITVPFPPLAARPGWQQAWSPQNFIDEMVVAEWEQLGLCPGPPAGDAEFMRRAYLDLIGTLPSPEEVLAFLAEAEPGKRARLVERLLARPEYVEYWSLKWGDLLRAHRRYLGEKGLASFQSWLRAALRENRPVDAMVRELLTAQGNLYANGANASTSWTRRRKIWLRARHKYFWACGCNVRGAITIPSRYGGRRTIEACRSFSRTSAAKIPRREAVLAACKPSAWIPLPCPRPSGGKRRGSQRCCAVCRAPMPRRSMPRRPGL